MTNLLEAVPPGSRSQTHRSPGQLLIELELSAKSIHHAKTMVKESVCLWGLDESAQDVELVVAELLTNVMRHTAPATAGEHRTIGRCLVQRAQGGVVVVVHDDDPALPQERAANPDSVDGRGLMIVRALAADMTVVPSPTGKDVVALLSVPGACAHSEETL